MLMSMIIRSQGQLIGVVAADDPLTAAEAARCVKVDYEPLDAVNSLKVG